MASTQRNRQTFDENVFDLKDYLRDLDAGSPLYRDHYNFNQANAYTRFAVDKGLASSWERDRDTFPRFNPCNLSTVDVITLFKEKGYLYESICKIVAGTSILMNAKMRETDDDANSKQFFDKLVGEAESLQDLLHDAIPMAENPPDSAAMNPSQYCLACIIADLSNMKTSVPLGNTYKCVMFTGGLRPWALFEPEGLVMIVEHFKVFLTGKVLLNNQDQPWAKVTYLEPKNNVKTDPVPISTTTTSIIIGRNVGAAPADNQLVLELNDVYEAHPQPNEKMKKARKNVSTIRLDFIDNTIIWLSTRSGSAKHNSYFRQNQPKKSDRNDAAGFKSRGPMYHLMVTFARLNYFNALRRFDSHEKYEDYKKILLDYSNLKIGPSNGGEVDNHKFEEEFPCLVNVEVLSDYVQRLLKQKRLTMKDKLLKEIYSLHGFSTKLFSYEELQKIWWLLRDFLFNELS